jgi:hypothetical protein
MIAALAVEIVGDEGGWPHIALAVIGPVLIAGAAVFAAMTARRSAIERQEEQLAHDTERQEKALAHDREMRDRESTRIVIDDAMEAVNATIPLFTTLEGQVEALQHEMSKGGRVESPRKEAVEGYSACLGAQSDLSLHLLRLRTRPNLKEMSDAYAEVRGSYKEHREALFVGLDSILTDEQSAAIKKIDEDGTDKIATLMTAWWKWLGGEDS